MQKTLTKQDRPGLLIWALLLLLTAGLAVWIRPAADDFYYTTYMDAGWEEFWANHLIHYRTMSGRVFVHLLLNPLLMLDMWPFRVFFVAVVALFSLLTARLCAGRGTAMALTLGAFWLLGIETLSDAALWGAGTMNYLFPVTLVVLYAALLQRFLEGRGGLWLCIPAFLCASTVEMNGILPIVVFAYLCLTRWEEARRRGWRTGLIGLCTLLGYLFLFTSQGVGTRLSNSDSGLTLLEQMLTNYALIDRKAVGPEGVWVIVLLALASSGLVLWKNGDRRWAGVFLLGGLLVTLTGTGIVYDGVAVAVIAIFAFSLLAGYGVWSFLRGERQIPLWMLCTTVSLGVCLVSPVMGGRLIMPTGMMLTIVFVRNMMLLPKWHLPATALIAAVACIVLVGYTAVLHSNALVIDSNTRLTEAHDGSALLVLERVPDESYSAANVPSGTNFGLYYLKHHDLTGVSIRCQEPSAATVQWDGGTLEDPALLRSGQYYIPIRSAAQVLGAEVRWELASAVVETGDGIWCFHKGNLAANHGHGICSSDRLRDPVRAIDGRNYISVRDFEALFGVELTILPPEG